LLQNQRLNSFSPERKGMEVKVDHLEDENRFEVKDQGETAVLEYKATPRKVYLIHTGVPEKLKGKGIASALARTAIEFVKQSDREAVIICPYIKLYIKRHPEVLEGLRFSLYP